MATDLTYNGQQYKISDLQYPEDLDTSEQYGKNKVIFLINVTSESKIRKQEGATAVVDIPASEYKVTATKDITDATMGLLVDKLELPQPLKVLGKMKRLTSAISLYIPNDLNMNYGVTWGEEDLGSSELVAETIGAIVNSKSLSSAAEAIMTGVGTKIGSSILSNNPAISKALRATPGNSKAEQLFKSVDFRTFNFNYSFAPKNRKEAETVIRIIRTFRHHMLPEFADENQFIYVYPSEFEIKYFRGASENKFLEKHFTAVLTNCNINYTPNGQFVTFGGWTDDDEINAGMPAQINMSLTFKELSVPTKETSPDNAAGT